MIYPCKYRGLECFWSGIGGKNSERARNEVVRSRAIGFCDGIVFKDAHCSYVYLVLGYLKWWDYLAEVGI